MLKCRERQESCPEQVMRHVKDPHVILNELNSEIAALLRKFLFINGVIWKVSGVDFLRNHIPKNSIYAWYIFRCDQRKKDFDGWFGLLLENVICNLA